MGNPTCKCEFMSDRLTLSQMRAFEAVARTGSVLEASRDLRIAQPSVSTQARAFEAQSGSRLFLREGKGFSLTPLGQEVFQQVRIALSMVDDVTRILVDQKRLARGVLRIGYSAHQYAMPLLAEFAKLYPGIKLEARSMASQDLLDRLDRNLLDVAMVTGAQLPERLFIRVRHTERVVLMVPASHPLAAHSNGVDWDQIKDISLVRREASSGTRQIFEAAAAQQELDFPAMVEVGSWSSMVDAVSAGLGIGLAVEGELAERKDLVAVPINDPALSASHCIVTQEKMEKLATVKAFFELAIGPDFLTSQNNISGNETNE